MSENTSQELEALTAQQLREMADGLGIAVPANAKKADLVAAIQDAESGDDAAGSDSPPESAGDEAAAPPADAAGTGDVKGGGDIPVTPGRIVLFRAPGMAQPRPAIVSEVRSPAAGEVSLHVLCAPSEGVRPTDVVRFVRGVRRSPGLTEAGWDWPPRA